MLINRPDERKMNSHFLIRYLMDNGRAKGQMQITIKTDSFYENTQVVIFPSEAFVFWWRQFILLSKEHFTIRSS